MGLGNPEVVTVNYRVRGFHLRRTGEPFDAKRVSIIGCHPFLVFRHAQDPVPVVGLMAFSL